MQNKSLIVIFSSFLLLTTLISLINIEIVNAFEGSITINADGSISPETSPVQQIGNLYLVTDDLNCSSGSAMVILKSNITIDGQGHTITGTRQYGNTGIYVGATPPPSDENVTIKNFEIKNFNYGILVGWDYEDGPHVVIHKNKISSAAVGIMFSYGGRFSEITENTISECTYAIDRGDYGGLGYMKISKNTITSNKNGIMFRYGSAYNTIVENNITNNDGYGIFAEGAHTDYIAGNNFISNRFGIFFTDLSMGSVGQYGEYWSQNNTIVENCFDSNTECGLYLLNSTWARGSFPSTYGNYLPNYVYHNIFKNNTQHVSFQNPLSVHASGDDPDAFITILVNSTNVMDNGYPSGGNYWDDYTGIDVDGDGIGDTPYIIDDYNTDRYPLVKGCPDFVVPEVPFGSLVAILAMVCAISVFVLIKKRTR